MAASDRDKPKAPLLCPKNSLFLESESNAPGGRGVWYARVPAEHSIEDVLKPEYFGLHIQGNRSLRAGDLVDIEPESAIWRVQARVMAVLPAAQLVRVREAESMRQNYEVKAPAGYKFMWTGEEKRWAIYKGEHLVDAGFHTQDECLEHVGNLQREKAA